MSACTLGMPPGKSTVGSGKPKLFPRKMIYMLGKKNKTHPLICRRVLLVINMQPNPGKTKPGVENVGVKGMINQSGF